MRVWAGERERDMRGVEVDTISNKTLCALIHQHPHSFLRALLFRPNNTRVNSVTSDKHRLIRRNSPPRAAAVLIQRWIV